MLTRFRPLILLTIFSLTPVRRYMESGMATHMLLQLPLLAAIGVSMGARMRPPRIVLEWDPSGLALLLVALFATFWWMIPRNLDAVLQDGYFETAKFLILPFLVGAPLAWSWKRLSPLVRAVVLVHAISMSWVMGWLFLNSPARLCSSYLPDQQVIAGRGFLILGSVIALLAIGKVFRGANDSRPSVAGSSGAA